MRFMHKLLSAQGKLDDDKVLLLSLAVSVSFVFVRDLWLLVACRPLLLVAAMATYSSAPACLPAPTCAMYACLVPASACACASLPACMPAGLHACLNDCLYACLCLRVLACLCLAACAGLACARQ